MIRQIAHHITRRYLTRRASDAANNMTGSERTVHGSILGAGYAGKLKMRTGNVCPLPSCLPVQQRAGLFIKIVQQTLVIGRAGKGPVFRCHKPRSKPQKLLKSFGSRIIADIRASCSIGRSRAHCGPPHYSTARRPIAVRMSAVATDARQPRIRSE